jgi:hypothetical protein
MAKKRSVKAGTSASGPKRKTDRKRPVKIRSVTPKKAEKAKKASLARKAKGAARKRLSGGAPAVQGAGLLPELTPAQPLSSPARRPLVERATSVAVEALAAVLALDKPGSDDPQSASETA